MGLTEGRGPKTVWKNPAELIRVLAPENPVMVLDRSRLRATAQRFLQGFPGLVTYAVKSNPHPAIIRTLVSAGVQGFDVASPFEIDLISRLAPKAARHYHNPVRSRSEIAHAVEAGIKSWSVDSRSELQKIFERVPVENCEISARFKLPVLGAAYDFGSKFGASPELTAELLREIAGRGYIPSLNFHPGTQCVDPHAWESYIATAAEICRMAGVKARRLNVGGGFPSHRIGGIEPDLTKIFDAIETATATAFGADRPELVCEPGRGICADAHALVTRIKAVRDDTHVFLNDGVYGGLTELPQIGNLDRLQVLTPEGVRRGGAPVPRVIFGPTCDSLDRLPGEVNLPADVQEGDYVIFHGAGAYSTVTNTRFNGFGQMTYLSVQSVF
ncbi:type III PLP-dependent enzyme [Paracoccus aestuariivivens]|uniref:ornithine decarboxylase n=1 Tax=Paracoccus aestuariivivens TaxID=1820333 RepID=A0A6L6J535_9RHOB|nr:type III PLP-dependent enzyme [Paracoccus aestuariivivens]MTH76666.1 type III PLP-dependent enzyme [Paracoccus aestuariivivens]